MDNQFYQPGVGYPPQQPAGSYPQGGPVPQGGPIPQGDPVPQGYMQPPMMGQMPIYPGAMPQNMPVQPMGQMPMMGQMGYQPPVMGQTGYEQPVQMPVTGYQQPVADQPQGYPAYQQMPYSDGSYQHLFNYGQVPPEGTMMPPQTEEMPPEGFPPQQIKPKRRKFRLKPFHVAVIVVVLAFAGWFLYSQLAPEAARYGTIALGSLSASHSGDCLIVRNEAPYDYEGVMSITYLAEEGSAVERDAQICKVYSSGYSTREMRNLQESRTDIRNYQKELIESETGYDERMARVTNEVMTRVREVRALIGGAHGSLSNQEKLLTAAVEARQVYLKEKYTADQRYSRLYDDERSQSQRIDSWTREQQATSAGIVSFYSDGYEYGLNGTNYTTFEPHEVRAMINGRKPELTTAQKGKTTIYRTVKDGEWYILFLSDDKNWDPVNGQVYNLQMERFDNTLVEAEVVSFTRSGGELLVRLKVTGGVESVLYMRTCDAVLGESLTTLMVSERAIYVQDGMTGVVVVEGQTESFIPVNVVRYEDGNAYFQPVQQGLLFENMTVLLF